MSRASSGVKRKYCRLHGWAPHTDNEQGYVCCRCSGVPGLTRTEKIKAFLRGFKLPKRVRARDFVAGRFSE